MSEKDNKHDEQKFSGDEKNEGFLGTPEHYFESFSARLFSKIKASDELKDYPLLSGLEKYNPFTVPAGYFEAKEELLQYPVLRELKQRNFVVPADYFAHLPAAVANKIALQEELGAYETLAGVDKENVFALPENYFADFAGHVKEVVSPAQVIPLFGRALKKYSFAAAAAVALILTFAIVLINQNTAVQPQSECNTLACLSKKEIISSGVMQNISEESIIEMIDMEALSDSLSLQKDGKVEQVGVEELSDHIDVNTLTEEL